MQTIPIEPGVVRQTLRVALGDAEFDLALTWHETTARWRVDLTAETGEALLRGTRMQYGWPLLRGVAADARPAGELLLVDTQDEDEPTLESLGARHVLLYAEAA